MNINTNTSEYNNFLESLKYYLEYDNNKKILKTQYNNKMKELKKLSKKYEDEILKYLDDNFENEEDKEFKTEDEDKNINIIKKQVKYSKETIKEDNIKASCNKLFNDESIGNTLWEIIDKNRKIKEKVELKRHIPKK